MSDKPPFDPNQPFQAAPKPEFDPNQPFQAVQQPQERGWLENTARGAVNNLPVLGGIAGGIMGTPADLIAGPGGNMAGAAIGGYLGAAGKNLINSYIDPDKAPHTTVQAVMDPIQSGAIQGATEGVGQAIGAVASPILSKMSKPVRDYLKALADKKILAATGATGAQLAKFKPGTADALRPYVSAFDNPANIARKVSEGLDKAGQGIGDTLSSLDSQGVQVDRNTVLKYLKDKIAALSGNEGEKPLVNQLRQKAADIEEQIPGVSTDFDAENAAEEAGSSTVPISKSEEIKRSFDRGSKWNSNSDAATLEANREAAGAYRQAGEDAATQANPDMGALFQEHKKNYELLSPVAEAATKRANTLAQSPAGGLLDTAAAGTGALMSGKLGALAAPALRKSLAPRIAATEAVGADWLMNTIKAAPESFGKWSGPLSQAAARGSTSLGATNYLLQQTDPAYRENIRQMQEGVQKAADQQGDQ